MTNIALSVLDEYFAQVEGGPATREWERRKRRLRGQANYRLIRYADDFLVMISGDREHAEHMRDVVAAVLAPMGLRLSEAKTMITHIDEGLDFLGWRIQRHRQRGSNRQHIYTYPARKALKAVMAKVKMICRQNNNEPLAVLLRRLNPVLRGWATYFRAGVSAATLQYLSKYAWERVMGWIRRKHRKMTWNQLRHRFCDGGWVVTSQWPSSRYRGPNCGGQLDVRPQPEWVGDVLEVGQQLRLDGVLADPAPPRQGLRGEG